MQNMQTLPGAQTYRVRGPQGTQFYNLNRHTTSLQTQLQASRTYRNPHHETLQPRATKNENRYGSSSIFAQNKQMISDAVKTGGANARQELTAPSGGRSALSSPGRGEEEASYLEIADPQNLDLAQSSANQKRLQTAGAERRAGKN
jgi:hypothetical protein